MDGLQLVFSWNTTHSSTWKSQELHLKLTAFGHSIHPRIEKKNTSFSKSYFCPNIDQFSKFFHYSLRRKSGGHIQWNIPPHLQRVLHYIANLTPKMQKVQVNHMVEPYPKRSSAIAGRPCDAKACQGLQKSTWKWQPRLKWPSNVLQGHQKWHQSKASVWFPISIL